MLQVCFTCLKTKFSLFGAWSTKCKMCNRYVCSKCVSKVRWLWLNRFRCCFHWLFCSACNHC